MKKLLAKFGVHKDIKLNYESYVMAGGYLPRADFERVFLAPKKEVQPTVKKRRKRK